MNTTKERAELLLERWCEGLLARQMADSGDGRLDGALVCGCCAKIHGRCADAMYPFLAMAARGKGQQWVDAAMALFFWSERTLSQPDGALLNDVDSQWTGITVFSLIGWAHCYLVYRHLLPSDFVEQLRQRILLGADYLHDYEAIQHNNINYPITNALALELAYRVTGEQRFSKKGAWFAQIALSVETENHLIFGEGVPRSRISAKGCRPIDIGYNVEETLPALALYAHLVGDEALTALARRSLASHLGFMFPDGGWDNSFGTRNFKWTWWGSRTSDGCLGGYLLFAPEDPRFARAAAKNLALLESSTMGTLLAGGPHYGDEGQPACIHHSFEHASMLAQALDRGLFDQVDWQAAAHARLVRELAGPPAYYPELATLVVCKQEYTATVTAYDWHYLEGGHVSGGTLSALFSHAVGPIFAASVGEYSRKEANNMQVPTAATLHQCLAPRIEHIEGGQVFSSIYEDDVQLSIEGDRYVATGFLKTKEGEGGAVAYTMRYEFKDDGLSIEAAAAVGGFILPVISRSDETVEEAEQLLHISRKGGKVALAFSVPYQLAYGTKRIFNLVPGLQALRIDLPLDGREVAVQVTVLKNE